MEKDRSIQADVRHSGVVDQHLFVSVLGGVVEGDAVGEVAHIEVHGVVSWREAVERFLSLGHGAVRDEAGTKFLTKTISANGRLH